MKILIAVALASFAGVFVAGCHPHLGKEFGQASRAAFSAQYVNLNGPGPLGLDGKEAELSMQKRRAPDGNGQGAAAPALPMLPLIGGK